MSIDTRMMAFMLMTLGMFMASLDIQIVASSITEIQGGLSATSDEISLIQTSYLIGEVIMIPMSGWLSRMLSTRWLFTLSAVGFTLSSLGCALAWNIQSMVAFRAIQGFLGGAMIPTVFAAGFSMFANNQARIPAVLGLIATLAPWRRRSDRRLAGSSRTASRGDGSSSSTCCLEQLSAFSFPSC